MFGVVVCPRCHRAKGVDLSKKTTSCSCGFEIRVLPAMVRVRVGTERELIEAVRRVGAGVAGGVAGYEEGIRAPEKKRITEGPARGAGPAVKARGPAHPGRAPA